MILHFRQTTHLEGRAGELVAELVCVELPRLSRLQRRAIVDGELCEADGFSVACGPGHSALFPDIDGALDYLRANPLPEDIVAVPPWETSNERSSDRAG